MALPRVSFLTCVRLFCKSLRCRTSSEWKRDCPSLLSLMKPMFCSLWVGRVSDSVFGYNHQKCWWSLGEGENEKLDLYHWAAIWKKSLSYLQTKSETATTSVLMALSDWCSLTAWRWHCKPSHICSLAPSTPRWGRGMSPCPSTTASISWNGGRGRSKREGRSPSLDVGWG